MPEPPKDPAQQAADDKAQSILNPVPDPSKVHCDRIDPWSPGSLYSSGDFVSYKKTYYRAIRATKGNIPGMTTPPHWQPIQLPCAAPREK